jgi:hypothetical protein
MFKSFSAHLIKFFKRGNSSGAKRFCNDVMAAISEETKDMRNVNKRFLDLYQKWKAETIGVSSVSKIVLNPNYLKIIAIGEPAIPLILASLNEKPDHWFIALSALTDDVPTSPGDNFDEAIKKWLEWGFNNGYLKCTITDTCGSEETREQQTEELSFSDAHLRALVILAETEARIQLERQQEFSSLFADEDINT